MDEHESVVIAVLAVVVAIVLSKLPPTATSQKGKNNVSPRAAVIDYTEPIISIYGTNRTIIADRIKIKTTKSTSSTVATVATTTATNSPVNSKSTVANSEETIDKSLTTQVKLTSTNTIGYKEAKERHRLIYDSTPTTIAIGGYFYQKGRPRPITLTTAIATTSTDEDAVDYPRLRELYRRTKHSLVFLLIFEIDFLNFIVL